MMKRVNIRAALAATCVIAAPAAAQETAEYTPLAVEAKNEERIAWLDATAPLLLARHDVPSVGIAFIDNGELQFTRHYGYQQWGYPANGETLYNIASMTKPVSAEIVLRLIDRGDLALGTPLVDHHVEEDVADDPRAAQLTPELVMHHRTGFPNWRYETDDVLQFIHDPDTKTGYSGEGYEWMAHAAAAAAGEDFETLARELIFDPAGMRFSGYTRNRFFPYRTAFPYKAGEAVYNMVREEFSASDDMRTTTSEYAAFMLQVFEQDTLSPELRERQRTIAHFDQGHPRCPEDSTEAFCPENMGWGLGWYVYDYGDRKIMEHSGGDQGERTIGVYDLAARRGIIVFTNGAEGHHVMLPILAALHGDPRFAEFQMTRIEE
ncbi:serine hydrolase domain-containing protein [Aurantiacibacter poecillastricola]|uniref:serine hydrolase domain-containing protein n=1 Tax=Aurantiacibacter poecillastricola TaxID=3064385 RepID=UPI00273DCE9C|nr:serine hydrolase domain-containing protein [Aurantiacibacter sp. 219JJ12-13]MDP5262252.1 serine hydrolase domain-containing protein [Aurantiacibacter sp. 219JJ12-13]